MDRTFEWLWKRVLVYAPKCPIPLAQEFINTAYSRAISFYRWNCLRKEGGFFIEAPYQTGTVTVTEGSTSVVGSGTTWTTDMEGMQFLTAGIAPYFTVVDVASATSLTLDRPYSKEDGVGLTYSIQQIYLEAPSDFVEFESVRDLVNNWSIRFDVPQAVLDTWDAQRTFSGDPWLLSPAAPSSSGLRRYEIWPRPGASASLPFRYYSKPPLLSANSDTPIFPIRGDILVEGALSELAKWPGLVDAPNPFFNLSLHKLHNEEFEKKLHSAAMEDQESNQTWIKYADEDRLPFAPIDAKFWQTHGLVY